MTLYWIALRWIVVLNRFNAFIFFVLRYIFQRVASGKVKINEYTGTVILWPRIKTFNGDYLKATMDSRPSHLQIHFEINIWRRNLLTELKLLIPF